MRTRIARAPLGALALCLALVLPALADLEVTMPPGTPFEWWRELPDRYPRLRGTVKKPEEKKQPEEKKPEEKKPEGKGTQEKDKDKTKGKDKPPEPVKTEVRSAPEMATVNHKPMIFMGVLTEDLPIHCGWVKRQGELGPRQYPPGITDDLYWHAQVGFLRYLCHPSLVPQSEAFWYLVLQGDCALEVAKSAKTERYLTDLATNVVAAIPALPKDPPAVPDGGDTPEDKMLMKLCRDDLADGDPFELDPAYSWRLLSLGEAGLPALLAAAKSEHPLLRRNAACLLGGYPMPEADEALRKMFKEDKDLTVKTRALFNLVRHKDATIVPDLVAMLASTEKYRPPLAAFGLGMIGTKDCVQPLVDAMGKKWDDWDFLVAATPALARCGAADDKAGAIPILKKLEESLRGAEPRFKEDQSVPRPGADIPDNPPVKNRMLLELATIALARLGDKDGTKKFDTLMSGGYEDKEHPVGHANASGPQRADQSEAMKFVCPPSYQLVVETWSELGKAGVPFVKQVIENVKSNERLRMFALHAPEIAKDKTYLQVVALNSDSPTLRALAMRMLYPVDEATSIKIATSVFATYCTNKPMPNLDQKGDMTVVAALEILHKAKKLRLDILKPALKRAQEEWAYLKPEVTPEGMKPFWFSPPIIEMLCDEMSFVNDKAVVPLLKQVAKDNRLPMRSEAVVALGYVTAPEGLPVLVELLEEEDGWVRYNAYLALRMKGQDHFADWIYGSKDDMKEALAAYKALVKKK